MILLCHFSLKGNAQFEHKLFNSNMLIETKFNYGFIYAQHLELEIFNSHVTVFEVNLQQQTFGKRLWERTYNYPIIGMAFQYSGLGRSPYLGSSYSLFPFINFPLYRHKNLFLGFRFGLGVGYLTKKFDRLTNYKDLAIGGHFNASVNLMFDLRYQLTERLTLSGGIDFQHFSNGSLKLPNYGVNVPLINIGIAFRPQRPNKSIGERFYPPTEPFSAVIRRMIEYNIGFSIAYKNMISVYGENFFVFHIYENTFIRISRKSKFGLGLDASYDQSQLKLLETRNIPVPSTYSLIRPGINAAYELILSRLGFILNLGYYLGGKEKSNGPLYEKVSFQYNITNHFFVNVMLKVHFGRADYLAWGIGYRFNQLYGRKTVKTQ